MISLDQLKDILANDQRDFIEELARKSREATLQYFGRAISLYAPIYLANYCSNYCLYCGFAHNREFPREKLTAEQMRKEMEKVSETGMQNILLLTGESRKMTPVSYLKEAVSIAKEYFPSISLEVYPLETEEYRELFETGADGVTIYQETYNRERYKFLHPKGKKADYDYRYATPERIARAGIRSINMGVLLGLSDVAKDMHNLFLHVEWLEKHFPGVEYTISFPRLIPLESSPENYIEVTDITLIKLICLTRILFPRVGINLSTREGEYLRDNALMLGVTKISAASKTTVGGYSAKEEKDPQFDVMDNRSVQEIVSLLEKKGFDPVFTDWRRIQNK